MCSVQKPIGLERSYPMCTTMLFCGLAVNVAEVTYSGTSFARSAVQMKAACDVSHLKFALIL